MTACKQKRWWTQQTSDRNDDKVGTRVALLSEKRQQCNRLYRLPEAHCAHRPRTLTSQPLA